jgi:hypothetical protein
VVLFISFSVTLSNDLFSVSLVCSGWIGKTYSFKSTIRSGTTPYRLELAVTGSGPKYTQLHVPSSNYEAIQACR